VSKTNSTFKLSKSAKRIISSTNKEERHQVKRLLIEAELTCLINKNRRSKPEQQESSGVNLAD